MFPARQLSVRYRLTTRHGMPENPLVKILQRPRGWIRVSPSERTWIPAISPSSKRRSCRWPLTSLLDVLNETD